MNINTNYSFLFSNTSSSLYSSLQDYATIKSGSYRKLLKAYYAKQKSDASDRTTSSNKTTNSFDSATKTTLNSIKTSADELKTSADTLRNSSLWEKKSVTTKDTKTGATSTTQEYDREAIEKAVKSFVEDYNTVLEDVSDSTTSKVLRPTSWMTKITSARKNVLKDVGMTISSDNKLTLDETKLKNADISTLKSVFSGTNSFSYEVSLKAGQITTAVNSTLGTSVGTYNSSALAMSLTNSGNLFDSLF